MDVSVRLSLRGGHHWEFVCDEDDPMVFGLVSALPGATLDASLPADGLIQVEARNGQRLFLSRSSLVALTIERLPARAVAALRGPVVSQEDAPAFLTSTPFVMHADVFDGATIERLAQTSRSLSPTDSCGLQALARDALPEAAGTALVRVLSSAGSYLLQGDFKETYLDLVVRRVWNLPTVRLPVPAESTRLLDFAIWLPAIGPSSPSVAASLPDRWLGCGELTPSVRTLPLRPNVALVFPAAHEPADIELQISGATGPVTIVSGSLCQGYRG